MSFPSTSIAIILSNPLLTDIAATLSCIMVAPTVLPNKHEASFGKLTDGPISWRGRCIYENHSLLCIAKVLDIFEHNVSSMLSPTSLSIVPIAGVTKRIMSGDRRKSQHK